MKHKLFLSLLLVTLILSMTGTAFAQEPLPPAPGEAATLSKNEAGLSRKAQDSQQPVSLASNELVTATTQLVNGDFEQGRFVGWSESSFQGWPIVTPSNDLPTGISPHGGNWAVWLGGDNDEQAYISQSNITIASPASLRLWYWIVSTDDCGYDYGYVLINASPIYTWNLCQGTSTGGWVPLDLSLDAYNGQTISLTVSVSTDVGYYSNLFIDDVSLAGTFSDVPYGYWAESYIQRLYNAGVTGGCAATSPLRYCPGTVVTRDQMAVFLLKGKYGSGFVPPDVGSSTGFNDVPVSYWAAAWIKQLAAEGITGGCGNGNYCPASPVTRDQMAVFLLKSEHGSNFVPPAAIGVFADVPTNYWAAAWIEQLAAEGITGGCGTGTYCPGTAVTRDQMAVFLVRTFALP